MRIAFYGLLLLNFVLFGWSQWLAPAPAPAPAAAVAAPSATAGAGPQPARIVLASERPAVAPADPAVAGGAASPPATGEGGVMPAVNGAAGVAAPSGEPLPATAATASTVPSSTAGPTGVVPVAGAGAAVAGSTRPAGMAGAPARPGPAGGSVQVAALAAPARRCASMGPFSDPELTAQATAMLKQDGYEPRQRTANGAVPDSYMVVIRRLRNEAEQARVVGRLNRGGLDDAFPIPKLDDGHAVSVGLFSQARRAERRALAVGKMGFKAEIVERTRPGTVYWLDFDLKTPAGGSSDPFATTADPSQKWQVVPCPGTGAVG